MLAQGLYGLLLSCLLFTVSAAQSLESPGAGKLDAFSFYRPSDWQEQRKHGQLLVSSPEQDQWYEVWEIRGFSEVDGVKIYIDTFFSVLYGRYQKKEVAGAQSGRGLVFQGEGVRDGLEELFQYCILQPEEKFFFVLLSRSDSDRPPLDVLDILRETRKL